MYQIIETEWGSHIHRLSDGAIIPEDSSNSDYNDYQEWCAQQAED